MSLFSRRIALLAATTATAVVGTLALPAAMASAADPISGTAGPVLTGPSDSHRVVLSWAPSAASTPYATGYELQISPNQDWTNDTVSLPNGGLTSNKKYEVPISLPHGSYYWRVRAVDSAGHSNWSSSGTFLREWATAMSLLTAPTGADPTISWAPVQGASLYRVRFSTMATFPSDAAKTAVCWTASTSFTPYTLQTTTEKISGDCMKATDIAGGLDVYWDVRAYDDSTAPILIADTTNDPNFDCATAQPECDAFSLDSTALAATPGSGVASPTITWNAPAAGSPASSSVAGLTSTWHTDTAAQTACDNTNTNACPITPTFSWTPIAGANFYEVTVYRDPAFSNVYRVYDTQWPSLTPRDAYLDAQAGTGYFWSVAAGTCTNSDTDLTCGAPVVTGGTSSGGGTGAATPTIVLSAFSSMHTFDKRSGSPIADSSYPSGFRTQTITLASPANNSRTNGATGTFAWSDFFTDGGQSAFDVRNYRLQIASDANFDTVVLDVPTIDMTQYTPQVADLADGDYYWRVQPVDESGNGLAWSDTRHFTRDATPPVFRLTDTAKLPITGAKFHLTVSETDLTGAVSAATVQIVPVVGGGAALPGSWSQTDVGAWTFATTAKLVPGQSYALHLNAGITDLAGNPAQANSHAVRATTVADDRSGAWSFPSGATRHSASGALGGTHVTIPSGKSATLKFVGSKALVYGCKSPSLAKLVIVLDGKTITTVSERQSFTKCGVLLWSSGVTSTVVHTLKLTASGGQASIDEARTV